MELLERHPNVTLIDCYLEPWRFDAARNYVLERIPDVYDLYVSLDLDEIICPGALARLLCEPPADRIRYTFNWSHHPDGRPDVVFFGDKMHSRSYRWIKPVHEVLQWQGAHTPLEVVIETVVIDHWADPAKPRSSYLPLLEASVQEDPSDPRNAFYLGREYFFYDRHDQAIAELCRYLDLPGSNWSSERSFAMQYLAKCFALKGLQAGAEMWYLKATMETTEREPFIALSEFYCGLGLYQVAFTAASRAYQIKERPASHYIMTHYAQNGGPEHLMSYALWHLGRRSESKKYAVEAVMQDPLNTKFATNLVHYKGIADA